MILFIDNHDSFTWNLVDYLHRLGQEVEVLSCDEVPDKRKMEGALGMVLSPGPGRPVDSGYLNVWLKMGIESKVPILGVCLGMQAIGEFYGAELGCYANAVHGSASKIKQNGSYLFKDIPEIHEVGRYHSLSISGIKKPLDVIASTLDGIVMAVSHENGMIHGVQFHPESILSPFGLQLLGNWLAPLM